MRTNFQRCLGGRVWFSTSPVPGVRITEPSQSSAGRRFRDIPLDHKLLRHLDALQLGRSRRRKKRGRAGQGKGTEAQPEAQPPPRPFGSVGRRSGVAKSWSELPASQERPVEIAFAGRSNVGKSTLLNVLVGLRNRPQVRAAVSATPGLTQDLQFFALGHSSPLMLVDMPGYGFAFAPDDRIEDWSELMLHYLRYRGGALRRLCLLVDARHGFKAIDRQFLELLYSKRAVGHPPEPKLPWDPPKLQLVLTKCDLVDRFDLVRRISLVKEELDDMLPPAAGNLPLMAVGALEGRGVLQLQRELASLVPPKTSLR